MIGIIGVHYVGITKQERRLFARNVVQEWGQTMTRPIDAEALKEALKEIFDTVDVVLFEDILSTIDNAPTIEITHGEWDCKEVRWTDKLSIDADGNIRDFNGRIRFIHPTYNMDEYVDWEAEDGTKID